MHGSTAKTTRRTPPWYARLPILGPTLQEALHPETVPARRYGEREDRSRRLKARILALLALTSGAVYLIWVMTVLDPAHPWMGGAFVAAELACLGLFALATLELWHLRYKSPEGVPLERHPSVDVFVTVCGESPQVVRRTLRAVARIRWRGELTVYVLDDGASSDVKHLADEVGFHYLARREAGVEHRDAKAGNLNFGLSRSEGELVLVLDADQVPRPEILEVLAGYMRFPRVGFVQSKQDYLVPEGDPFYNLDEVFYEAVQLGFDDADTVISCGSAVLYRRRALEEIGGFANWNLVEDLTTSYELHSRGWKSFFHPYPLAKGMAPDDIWGVYQQRGQWALDTMRLFFWDNPLLKRGLSWRQRCDYLVVALSYIAAAVVFPFFFLVPVWSYVTGDTFLTRLLPEFPVIRGAYFVFMALALRYMIRLRAPGRQFQALVGLFPIYLAAILRALRYPPGSKPAYRVNNGPTRRQPAVLAVLPQLAVFLANGLLPFYALWAGTAAPHVIAVNAVISAFALWALWQVLGAALGVHAWRREDRPEHLYGAAH